VRAYQSGSAAPGPTCAWTWTWAFTAPTSRANLFSKQLTDNRRAHFRSQI
jgi:hypothetical protein